MSEFITKTKEVATGAYNTARLHARILAEETKIRELYYKLGREYYEDFENNVDDISGLEELCADIKARYARIENLRKKVNISEHMKMCSSCGAVNPDKNFYCGRCGEKL